VSEDLRFSADHVQGFSEENIGKNKRWRLFSQLFSLSVFSLTSFTLL